MKKFKILSLFSAALLLPSVSYAYPNGTPVYLTDASPFCASCHSARRIEYMPELPREAAERELPENKHYGLIRSQLPISPYVELTEDQKEKIINTARKIDSNSSVTISAPARVKPNGIIKVTVKARGGNGPDIGVMLVDRALRYQSRPISSDGWYITEEPEIRGQDGKTQTMWLDRRITGLKRNLNFAMIYGENFDIDKDIYPEGTVTYTVKAPSAPGNYTLTAAFLYGTENALTAAFFQRPSGRILFSDELKITVE